MPRTRVELVARALGLLGITQAGQDPAVEDAELVDSYVDGKFAELARRRVVYVQSQDEIEDEMFLPLARIIANAAGPEFGKSRDLGIDADAEGILREMQREPGVNDVVKAEYF